MNTPRTDANDLGWQFNEHYGDFNLLSDTPMPWLDFAKMLETELATVTKERDEARKDSIFWQSLAEGRSRTDDDDTGKAMAKLIRQRDEARGQRDRLAAAIQE